MTVRVMGSISSGGGSSRGVFSPELMACMCGVESSTTREVLAACWRRERATSLCGLCLHFDRDKGGSVQRAEWKVQPKRAEPKAIMRPIPALAPELAIAQITSRDTRLARRLRASPLTRPKPTAQ
jgi:hypothetical protein